MPYSARCRLRLPPAILLFLMIGISAAFAQAPFEDSQVRPQAPPAARMAHKNYISWNPLDLLLSGRLSVGYEHIFRIGERYFGLSAHYTSPMNSVFGGIVTNFQTGQALSDEFTFPTSVDVFLCLHGKGRSRAMRYYPRIGLSSILNPEEKDRCLYLAFGPCGRITFSKSFHVTFALTTLKLKLQQNKGYNWLQLPVFDFSVGIEF